MGNSTQHYTDQGWYSWDQSQGGWKWLPEDSIVFPVDEKNNSSEYLVWSQKSV